MQKTDHTRPDGPLDREAANTSGEESPEPEAAPASHEIREASELLKVVGDLTRMRILCALLDGELSVSDLQGSLGMSQSAVSHQLRTLRDANLVSYRKEWKKAYYSLADDHVRDFLGLVVEHVRHD